MGIKNIFAAIGLILSSIAHAGFTDVEYHVSYPIKNAFGLAVIDTRDFLATQPEKANLLGGEVSGILGRRRELLTDSRKPVAEEISEALAIHFAQKKKNTVAIIPVIPGTTLKRLTETIKELGLKKTIVINIQGLWTEMPNAKNSQVSYQLEAIVLDETGNILGKANEEAMHHSRDWGTTATDEFVGRAISNLMANTEILKALSK